MEKMLKSLANNETELSRFIEEYYKHFKKIAPKKFTFGKVKIGE